MRRRTTHWYRIAAFMLVLLTATACYQAMGTDLMATDTADQQPTFTPQPSNTPILIELPITNTPGAATTGSLLPGQNPTLTADELLSQSFGASDDSSIAQAPTLTDIQQTMAADFLSPDIAGQQATDPPPQAFDEFGLTSTALWDEATASAAQQTQAAGGFPTAAPTIDLTPRGVVPQIGATLVPGADCIHEVRASDVNLYRIARNYGMTYQEIAAANNLLNPDFITIGQQLRIPGCGTTGVTPLPTSTPRPGAATPVPVQPQTGGSLVDAMTFTPVPQPGAQPAQTGGRVHIVQQGETLFQLSMRYNVPVAQIAAVNGIADYNRIYLGQQLTIP